MLLSAFPQYDDILPPHWINPAAVESAVCCKSFQPGLLLDKQIPAPSIFCGEAVQYALIPLSRLCSLSLLHVLASASTNRLIDPK